MIKHSRVETLIFHESLANIIVVDVLAPCINQVISNDYIDLIFLGAETGTFQQNPANIMPADELRGQVIKSNDNDHVG